MKRLLRAPLLRAPLLTRRLTTATTPISLSNLPQLHFPPPCRTPEASAKLPALHARLSLHPAYPIATLARALVDRSAEDDSRFNNASLATLGTAITQHHATEHLLITYPRLPFDILNAAIHAFVGTKAFASLGREWGIDAAFAPTSEVDAGLLQFKRLPPGSDPRDVAAGIPQEFAMATAVKAIFAGVYLHEGVAAARQFFRSHVLARKLEVEKMFDFQNPTWELARLCAREGFEPPVGRLMSETGRYSRNAVFIVGIYSGTNLLGEGHGGSLEEAKMRAAVNALKGWYLYSPAVKDVPSSTVVDKGVKYKPAYVDVGEVIL